MKDVCRKHGMSEASFYTWRTKYAGMQVSDAKRLRELEDEDRRPKKLVADQALHNHLLRELNSRNGSACCTPPSGRVAHD